MKTRKKSAGGGRCNRMTLAELLVAASVFLMVIMGTVGLSIYILQRQKELGATSDLRNELGVIIQYLRNDTALSSLEEMVFYPSPASTFLSISMPILQRPAADIKTAPVDEDGNVIWTHTVIYHTYVTDTGVKQMRRTLVSDRDNSRSKDFRYSELESVVKTGDGSQLDDDASTMVLCRNLDDFKVELGRSTFDTYDTLVKSRHLYMGTQVIEKGTHQITFTSAGHHQTATGQFIGVDALTLSVNESALEGEYLYDYSSASGAPLKINRQFSPDFSNGNEALFEADTDGDNFTFTFYNDTWLESTFGKEGASANATEIRGDEATGEEILLMAGMDTVYMAREEGADVAGGSLPMIFRVVVPGETLLLEGLESVPRHKVAFRWEHSGGGAVYLISASIVERASGADGAATPTLLRFTDADDLHGDSFADTDADAGATAYRIADGLEFASDWVDFPIERGKEYLVSIHLDTGGSENAPKFTYWKAAGGGDNMYELKNWMPAADGTDPDPVTLAAWPPASGGTTEGSLGRPLVQGIFVSHPEFATYTSRIFDTRMATPVFSQYASKVSAGTDLNSTLLRFRSGSEPDLSDASVWEETAALTTGHGLQSLGELSSARYVQFRVDFATLYPHETTENFHFMALLWPGTTRAVDVSGKFGYGPNRGQFTAAIDGFPLVLNNLTFHVAVKTLLSGKRQFVSDMDLVVSPRWQ